MTVSNVDEELFARLVPFVSSAIDQQAEEAQVECRRRLAAGLLSFQLEVDAGGWWVNVALGPDHLTRVAGGCVGLLDVVDEDTAASMLAVVDELQQRAAEQVPDTPAGLVGDDLPPAA